MKGAAVRDSYGDTSTAAAKARYDAWANHYEADLMAAGYRLPWIFATVACAFLPSATTPILDAGCGTGMQFEPLHLLGYRGITGIDMSQPMLDFAQGKGLYDQLIQATLGEALPFATDAFAATLCCGVITPGHAPAHALDELVRVTKRGGILIFSLRDDFGQLPDYPAHRDQLYQKGSLREIFKTEAFASLPIGEPKVRHRVHVCEVVA